MLVDKTMSRLIFSLVILNVAQQTEAAPTSTYVGSIANDHGYGSTVQEDTDIADALEKLRVVYGRYRPGKRNNTSEEFHSGIAQGKRTNTDFGYGSRLQAGENIADLWDQLGLFGKMGPGKRSGTHGFEKRIATDFGYGSRSRAEENAAKSLSYGNIFGIHGPGKRNDEVIDIGGNPDIDVIKRILSDYGYGSRMQTADNLAKAASNQDLYGIYGPGK